MTTHLQYRTYFKDLVTNSATNPNIPAAIKSFYFADARRIVEGLRSDIEYPTLWLEVPQVTTAVYNKTDKRLRWDITFAMLKATAVDDYDLQNDVWDNLFEIAKGVLRQLSADKTIWTLEEESIALIPISNALSDNDYGWRVHCRAISKQYFDICPI